MKGSYTEKICIIPREGCKKEVFRIFRQESVVMLDILGLRKKLYGKFPYNK
jgi:hypothetical protein